MIELKIPLDGGIGDCIRTLSSYFPIQAYYDKWNPIFGVKVHVSYGFKNDCKWEDLLVENLFNRNPMFHYVRDKEEFKRVKGHNLPYDPNICKTAKELPLGQIRIDLSEKEKEQIALDPNKRHVVMQLGGNDPHKMWQMEKWDWLARRLLERDPDITVHIVDAAYRQVPPGICQDHRIVNHIGHINFAQVLNLVQAADVLVAPDSYSKYVAGTWSKKTRSVVMISRVSYTTPEEMIRWAYPNLLFNERVKFVGIDYDKDLNVHSIKDDIKEIEAEEVLACI